MVNWITKQTTPVLSFGKWLSVEDRTVATPDGLEIEHWPWVVTPDYINVLARDVDGKYLIFQQGKYGYEGDSLAPVGGYIEPGEEPLAAAKRELLEETGYVSDQWIPLGHFQVDPNRGVAWGNFFLALNAHKVAERNADDLEQQDLLLLSMPDLRKALMEGRFRVLAWAANIAFALLTLADGN